MEQKEHPLSRLFTSKGISLLYRGDFDIWKASEQNVIRILKAASD